MGVECNNREIIPSPVGVHARMEPIAYLHVVVLAPLIKNKTRSREQDFESANLTTVDTNELLRKRVEPWRSAATCVRQCCHCI